jgi:hypothetical protein
LQSQQFRGLTEAATLGGSDGRSQVFQLESFAAAQGVTWSFEIAHLEKLAAQYAAMCLFMRHNPKP